MILKYLNAAMEQAHCEIVNNVESSLPGLQLLVLDELKTGYSVQR